MTSRAVVVSPYDQGIRQLCRKDGIGMSIGEVRDGLGFGLGLGASPRAGG